MAKQIDIIAKIYNGIIKGIITGHSLEALQGSARAGKSYQIMIFLIQCCLNPQMVNQYMYAFWISAHKRWEEKVANGDPDAGTEPKLMQRDKYHVSVVRCALPALKRSIFRDFVEIMVNMGVYDPRRMNKTEMVYTFANGSVMEFFATADNEQKVRGSKRDILFANEANELNSEEFRQLRMRTDCFSIVDFNPSFTEEHWLFPLLKDERTYHFVSTFIDNPFLSDAIKDEIMSYKYTNPALWQIFGMGEFAIVEGLVYPKETWDIVDKTELPIDVKLEKRIGIDVGFSGKGDPTAAVLCYTANINGIKHLWLEELVYEKGLNEKMLAYRLKPYNDIKKYIDSANPLYIQNLEDNGVQLIYPVVKYANSIIDGINKVQGYKIHVIRGSVNVVKELSNYCWMKDRHEAYTNTPIDKFNHCFVGDTMIATWDGERRIDSLRIGDLVWTSIGLRPVLKTFDNGIQEVWEVEMKMQNGKTVKMTATPDHKIITKSEQGWKRLRDLRKGDKVFLFNSSMEKNTDCIKENDISREVLNDFMLQYGNTIMAECQKVSMYTTLMNTQLITILTIWSYYLLMSIYRFTYKRICKMQDFVLRCLREWHMPRSLRKIGIIVLRGASGIVSTLNNKYGKTMNMYVRYAESLSCLENQAELNFAATLASLNGDEKTASTMRQEYALCVEKSLSLANSETQLPAEEDVLESIKVLRKHYEKTYNIMVDEKHEYYANGLLSGNCADAFRYAIMSDRSARTHRRTYNKSQLGFSF